MRTINPYTDVVKLTHQGAAPHAASATFRTESTTAEYTCFCAVLQVRYFARKTRIESAAFRCAAINFAMSYDDDTNISGQLTDGVRSVAESGSALR